MSVDPLDAELNEDSYVLNIRRFVQGKDEAIWVSVRNQSFREFEEFTSLSVEDMLKSEKSPNFDPDGKYIAEFDGEPVGIVNAYVDKKRNDGKSFIYGVGVVPEYRRRGIGRALVEKALESLRERGMHTVEAGAEMNKVAANILWETMGFVRVRVFSLMKRRLEDLPSNVGENTAVALRKIKEPTDDDIRLINWLGNDTFSEHYNFRPATIEETRYFLTEDPFFREQEWLIAGLNDSPIGYVGVGVDHKYNEEKNTKAAWILDIGVLKIHRKGSVGTRLMLEAMKLMKTKDMADAMLGVDDQNPTHAIDLYEKVGFHATRKDVAYQRQI